MIWSLFWFTKRSTWISENPRQQSRKSENATSELFKTSKLIKIDQITWKIDWFEVWFDLLKDPRGFSKIHISKVENRKIPHQNFHKHPKVLESVFWARRTSRSKFRKLVTPKILEWWYQKWLRENLDILSKNPRFQSSLTFSLLNIFLIGQNWVKTVNFLSKIVFSVHF